MAIAGVIIALLMLVSFEHLSVGLFMATVGIIASYVALTPPGL